MKLEKLGPVGPSEISVVSFQFLVFSFEVCMLG